MPELKDRHLADLHAIAAELDVPRYRLLPREDLVSAIEDRGGAPDVEAEATVEGTVVDDAAKKPAETDAAGPRADDEPTEEVAGVLDILPQRYGFLRIQGLSAQPGDVYISAAQIRRCELRTGDSVAGPAREPRRGERHRALVHVDQVNGVEPQSAERPEFDALPPVQPERRLPLDSDPGEVLLRAVDLLSPLALGQRVLVRAAQRSGRTTLLRGIARASVAAEGTATIVLLVDERPEEASAWREAVPDAEFAIATAEMAPGEQLAVADLALERARRRAESDVDAVLVVDSLTRMAQAAGDAAPVKRLFGSGRNLAGEGSLTVVATTIADGDDEGQAEHAVATTESCLVTLDPELAAAGVTPAITAAECRVSNEEEIRSAEELEAVRKLREELSGLESREAADRLRERIEKTPSNAELLSAL
jgi:transcription termination factor Rho